jgi:hypothetical protein
LSVGFSRVSRAAKVAESQGSIRFGGKGEVGAGEGGSGREERYEVTSFVRIVESFEGRDEVEEVSLEERAGRGGKAVKVIGERVLESFVRCGRLSFS